MSPSSITNPSAWVNPVGQNPLTSASAFGSGNFTGLLLQALQSGNTTASGSPASGISAGATGTAASGASATTGLSGAIGRGHHHGHHGGGSISAQQLLSMLQQINGGGASAPSASTALTAAATGTQSVGAASASSATAPVTLQSLLQNLQPGSAAARGVGRLLDTQA